MDHPVAQKWPPTVMTARLSDGLGSGRVPKMLGFPLGFFRGVGDISLIEGFEYHFSRQFGSDFPPKILSIWVPEPITSCGGSRNRHHTKVAEFLDGQDLIDNFMDYYDSMESIGFLFSRLCNCIEIEKK